MSENASDRHSAFMQALITEIKLDADGGVHVLCATYGRRCEKVPAHCVDRLDWGNYWLHQDSHLGNESVEQYWKQRSAVIMM